MKKYTIHKIETHDKPKLIELFFEFGQYLAELDKNAFNLLIVPDNYGERFYTRMIENVGKNNGIIYVLEIDNCVVGFVAGVIFEVGNKEDEIDCKPHKMGRVIELFINQKYRRQGLGKKLMKKIFKYFKNQNCYKVNIEVFAPNQGAYCFYNKLGFQDRSYDLIKLL